MDQRREVEGLYRQEGAKIWRALVLSTGDPEIARDACAEAFAQLLARGDAVRDPRAWVWKAALRIGDREVSGRRPPTGTIERSYEMPEPTVDLMRALARLSPTQRRSVVLRYLNDWTIPEIARALGTSRGAVAVHLHAGRRRLRDLLETGDD